MFQGHEQGEDFVTHVPTSQSSLSSAEICRQRGWTVGTRLVSYREASREDRGRAVASVEIELTAIGLRNVLGVVVAYSGTPVGGADEHQWNLTCANWEAAG